MKSRITTLAAGLLLALGAQVGVTAAAVDTSGTEASTALQGTIRIHLTGGIKGPEFVAVGRGGFTISGAISDSGRFVERHLRAGRDFVDTPFRTARTLVGANGTLWVLTNRRGHWTILKGTKAYAGLRGQGEEHWHPRAPSHRTLTGTVRPSPALRGNVVFACEGGLPFPSKVPRGRCTVSGAVTDRGRFFDDGRLQVTPHTRTFVSAKGTIEFSVYRERGHWTITAGTRAYANLRGSGWESNSGRCASEGLGCPIHIKMSGRVFQVSAYLAQPSTRIAFVRDRELYVMNADGSGQQRLAAEVQPVTPSWSPDARQIAFVTNRDGNPEIYVMNADGSDQRNVSRNSKRDGAPTWSPDGGRIAFESWEDGEATIRVVNPDGSGQRRLTRPGRGAEVSPVWSPDGREIAFVRKIGHPAPAPPGAPGGFHIVFDGYLYVANADGSGLRRLFRGVAHPVWSPDGRTIRFGRYVVNADGSGVRKLPRDRPPPGVWSPDGRKIALVLGLRRGSPFANYEIYVVNADGSRLRRLTHRQGGDSRPAWSPDGRHIAFRSMRDGNPEIYVMNADGSGQRNLTRNPASDGPFAWSPAR
jgi:Tol biopolymer transport system component